MIYRVDKDSRKAILINEWEIFPTDVTLDEKIGEGAFGTVFSAFVDIRIIKKSKYAKLQGGSALLGDKSCKVAVKLLKGKCFSNVFKQYNRRVPESAVSEMSVIVFVFFCRTCKPYGIR